MLWPDYVAYFFGGAFFANTVPHFVAGVSGRPFQSPFAKPPGVGQSSSVVNMVWALANLVIAWLLLARVGSFDIRDFGDAVAVGLGVAALGIFCAANFGRLNGGNQPESR